MDAHKRLEDMTVTEFNQHLRTAARKVTADIIEYSRSKPSYLRHQLEWARTELQAYDAMGRIDQCSQETLDNQRERVRTLEGALEAAERSAR